MKVKSYMNPSKILPPRTNPFAHWSRHIIEAMSLPFALFISVPLLILVSSVPISQILGQIGAPEVIQAIMISLKTTSISLILTIAFGTPLAYLMAKHQFPLKRVLDAIIDLPTVLPPLVAGVALLLTFGRNGFIGSWLARIGINVAFTQAAVVMAQLFIATPFYIRAASLGFSTIDPELEQACQLDGANRWQTFIHLTFPLSRQALISGGVMSWARSLGEFGATIMFAGNYPGRTQTMPLAVYLGFEMDIHQALTLSVILVGLSFLSLLAIKWILFQPIQVLTSSK